MKPFLPTKFKFVLIFLFAILISGFSFFAGRVYAADAFPSGGRVPCTTDTGGGPEFSSDRPYQASPCGDRPITYWCGNSVVVDLGSVHTPWCGDSVCPTNIQKDQNIDIDLTNVQVPILGNTQLTVNSQSTVDQIDDGTKVNDYLSWYLNGTTDKAEYPLLDPTTPEGINKIVSYSGPLKKLLPSIIQDSQRIETIRTATETVTYTPDAEGASTPAPINEPENHNQIVVCYNKQLQLPPWFTNFFGLGAIGIGRAVPTACYGSSGGVQGNIFRLKNWDNTAFDEFRYQIEKWILDHHYLPSDLVTQIIAGTMIDRWPKKIPPLPWSDKDGKPFATTQAYTKAYNEWRGDLCAYIPNPFGGNEILVCIRIPGITTSDYAELYPYVPLADTVDKKGTHMVTNTHITAPKATIECTNGVCYEIIHSPQLYIAHSLENYTLTNTLKDTYVAQNSTQSGSTVGIISTANPMDVENNKECRIVPSRTNPGDDATFTNPQSHIEVKVHYTVTSIECTTPEWKCSDVGNPPHEVCKLVATCQSEVYATINSIEKTPYFDEIWNNTVAGSDSIFRHIFPKTGPTAPVSCIADTPAQSNATYTLNGNSSSGLSLVRVEEPDKTSVTGANGQKGSDSIDAYLYYPHLGSVLDYFLNGIQTALRPQGYAYPVTPNGKYCKAVTPTTCQVNVPDSAVPAKYLGAFKANFIDLANRWTTDCPGPDFNLATQCYNYVVSQSMKAGINPAFTLTIWLNESDASNYCHGGPTTQDFGIGGQPDLWQNFTKQLEVFLLQPAAFKSCANVPGWIEPMEAFLSRFRSSSGSCNPSDPDGYAYYQDILNNAWPMVAGTSCVKNGKFAITWPTDMSCP